MATISMRQLLEAGIHFGHQTRRWNPKMAKYIYGQRNGIYIIDLQKTMQQMRKAFRAVRDKVAEGGTVLFVGTKRQAQECVAKAAEHCGMYYVNNRWLGGTLTNFVTVKKSVSKLRKYEDMESTGKLDALPKKEAARLRREMAKLNKNLKGVKNMANLPAVMFVIDAKKEAIAIREAERLGIICIAVADTNADPDVVPIPIPGNDDAIRAIELFCGIIAEAAIEGRAQADKQPKGGIRRGGALSRVAAKQGEAAAETATASLSGEEQEVTAEAEEAEAEDVEDADDEEEEYDAESGKY